MGQSDLQMMTANNNRDRATKALWAHSTIARKFQNGNNRFHNKRRYQQDGGRRQYQTMKHQHNNGLYVGSKRARYNVENYQKAPQSSSEIPSSRAHYFQ